MANETIAQITPLMLVPEFTHPHDLNLKRAPNGDAMGLVLRKLPRTAGGMSDSYVGIFCASHITAATNLEFELWVCDDGSDSYDLGKVVRLGVTIKRLTTSDNADMDSGAATEGTVDITLGASSGLVMKGTVSLAWASAIDGVTAGDLFMIRIRRVGTASQDTARGPVLLMFTHVQNSAS